MRVIVYSFLFFGMSVSVSGQIIDRSQKITEEEKLERKKFKNNFFTQRGFSVLSEYFGVYAKDELFSAEFVSLISYTHEFRYNLLNYKDFLSLSSSVPLSAGIYIGQYNGVGLKFPLCFDLNFFLNSTYNNIDQVGFYIGGGIHRMFFIPKSPLSQNHLSSLFARAGVKYAYRGRYAYFEVMVGRGNDYEYNPGLNANSKYVKLTFGRLLRL